MQIRYSTAIAIAAAARGTVAAIIAKNGTTQNGNVTNRQGRTRKIAMRAITMKQSIFTMKAIFQKSEEF